VAREARVTAWFIKNNSNELFVSTTAADLDRGASEASMTA